MSPQLAALLFLHSMKTTSFYTFCELEGGKQNFLASRSASRPQVSTNAESTDRQTDLDLDIIYFQGSQCDINGTSYRDMQASSFLLIHGLHLGTNVYV